MTGNGIRPLDGHVALDRPTATTIVDALDTLAALAHRHNARLHPDVRRVLDDLREFVSGAGTIPVVSASVDSESRLLMYPSTGFVSTAAAARQLGITPGGVRDLVRRRKLDGFKSGKNWLVNGVSVTQYENARNRKG